MITKDVYNKSESNWYDKIYVEPIIEQLQFFSNNALVNLNIQTSSMNGFKILTQLLIWNSKKKEYVPPRNESIHCIFKIEHWKESIKHEFLWFLFQDIFNLTVNYVEPQSEYLLFKSILKLFSLFKLQVEFDGDELSEVCTMCTCCNKNVHCLIYEVKQGFFTEK